MLPPTPMLKGLFVADCVLLMAWTMAHGEPATPRPDCYRAAGGLLICSEPPPVARGDIPSPKPPSPMDNGAFGTVTPGAALTFQNTGVP
jgi:hypothetical protein